MRTNHVSDSQEISKRNCEIKNCPNKAAAIFKKKFICKSCSSRLNPKKKDREVFSMRLLGYSYDKSNNL